MNEPRTSVSVVRILQVWLLMPQAVILVKMSPPPILVMTMALIETLLMFQLIFTLTFVQVIADTRNAICEPSSWANFAITEDSIGVLSLALQTLTAIKESDSAVGAEFVALKLMCFCRETAGGLLASWILERIDIICRRDEVCCEVERLNTGLVAVRKRLPDQMTVQSELHDAQYDSSRFEAR